MEEEEEEEKEEEEEEEGLAEVLVKGVMEGVGISPATFCFFLPLFRASALRPRTDASSSSVTGRPCGMGSLGCTAAKWAAMLYKIRSGYLIPAFSGVPNKGDKIKVGPKEGGDATSPLHSRGTPNKWGQN